MHKKKVKHRSRSQLAREAERNLLDQIRRLLALEPSKRTHFLRVRVRFRGSTI